MYYMFALSGYNLPLSNWNTSKVTDMSYMFTGSTVFNQDISSWDVGLVTAMNNMFFNSKLSTNN